MRKVICFLLSLVVLLSLIISVMKITMQESILAIDIKEPNTNNDKTKNVIVIETSDNTTSETSNSSTDTFLTIKNDETLSSNVNSVEEADPIEESEVSNDENSEEESNEKDSKVEESETSEEEYNDEEEEYYNEDIYISVDMDLKTYADISAEDINMFLNKYTSPDSLLYDKGYAFALASDASGYNALFLVAVAINESGWEVSPLHASKNNPYSISMYDWDVEAGYVLGDTFSDGIINGAKWIADNYYDNGQTTIYQMQHGIEDHIYASDPNWENNVISIMQLMYFEIYNNDEYDETYTEEEDYEEE